MILEESQAYDSKSNGGIENGIKSGQGQIRAIKLGLEGRINQKAAGKGRRI